MFVYRLSSLCSAVSLTALLAVSGSADGGGQVAISGPHMVPETKKPPSLFRVGGFFLFIFS